MVGRNRKEEEKKIWKTAFILKVSIFKLPHRYTRRKKKMLNSNKEFIELKLNFKVLKQFL